MLKTDKNIAQFITFFKIISIFIFTTITGITFINCPNGQDSETIILKIINNYNNPITKVYLYDSSENYYELTGVNAGQEKIFYQNISEDYRNMNKIFSIHLFANGLPDGCVITRNFLQRDKKTTTIILNSDGSYQLE